MAARVEAITKRPPIKHQAWKDLLTHYKKVRELHLRQLFADDPKRGSRMTAEAVGLLLDYSKNRITAETVSLLLKLAEESRLRERIEIDASPPGDARGDPARWVSCESPRSPRRKTPYRRCA